MSDFMFFIRKHKGSTDTLSPAQHLDFLRSCESYIRRLKSEGKLVSAQPIEWSGSILSRTNGNWQSLPFDTGADVIGGYYHIRADSLDEAISIARENPEFQFNPETRIEVRPLKTVEAATNFVYPTA
jgi:hypothetical protein